MAYSSSSRIPVPDPPKQRTVPGIKKTIAAADGDVAGKVDVVQELLHHVSKFVRQQPATALLISFSVGGLAAWLISKKSK